MLNGTLLISAIVAAVIVILAVAVFFKWKKSAEDHDLEETQEAQEDHHGQRRHHVGASRTKVTNVKVQKADGQTKVSWDPIPNASHYSIYYSPEPNFDVATANVHDELTDTSVLLASDVPRTYYFKVSSSKKVNGKVTEIAISDQYKMNLDVPKN